MSVVPRPADSALVDLRSRLLAWFDRTARDLPWRYAPGERADPYRVWLSEVMLQQTRVDTVKPYFRRWLERFASLDELAAADLDDVLKAWEGLGYYSRARHFHRAVREVVERYGGEVPSDAGAFRALPGVGRYTAGAVMSIAYGREEPVVDGNVRRVFARLLDDPDPSPDILWKLAGRLVVGERPGDLNQAVMELGATVCTPRSPGCEECPVADWCAARLAGTQEERPRRRRSAPIPTERHGVAIVEQAGRVLLRRRSVHGRLGGMWEFPGAATVEGESSGEAAVRVLGEIAGMRGRTAAEVGSVTHVFSHVRVIYKVFVVEAEVGVGAEEVRVAGAVAGGGRVDLAWATRDDLEDYALPRAQRRIIELLSKSVWAPALAGRPEGA